MEVQEGTEGAELARLRAELRSCRLELAQRHRELETLQEERYDLLRRCEEAEQAARELAESLEQLTTRNGDEPPAGGPGWLRRWAKASGP